MLNWMKKIAMSVAAMAVIGGASAAMADTVSYFTRLHFTAGASGGVVSTNTGAPSFDGLDTSNVITFTSGLNTDKLSFFVQTFSDTAFDPSAGVEGVSFGSFKESGNAVHLITAGAPVGFTLDIYQTAPGVGGPGTFVGSAKGSLK